MKRPSDFFKGVEDAAQETWQQVTVTTANWKTEAERLIEEGKLRRIVVKKDGKVFFQTHLFVGAIAVVAAPLLTAAGAMIALLSDCEIVLEVDQPKAAPRTRKTAKA